MKTASLKQKKDRLFQLERLKFEKNEAAWKTREDLRSEIIAEEKRIEANKKAKQTRR